MEDRMASLNTCYMGIVLKNPVIAGASFLTSHMDSIKKIEDAGAGGLVVASLFEEQIQLERFKLEEELQAQAGLHAEMLNLFPTLEHAGPEEHLMWIKKTKESVDIPVIASLNAVTRETWLDWALKLVETGADGLELNFFAAPSSIDRSGSDVEREQIEIVTQLKNSISIPLSVKLSPFYTNPLHFVKQLDNVGIGAVVLFNRFFQPDIDAQTRKHTTQINYSSRSDNRLPLRYSGLLHGEIKSDICASGGIMEAEDLIKMLLAGATCIQTVSGLYKNGITAITDMIKGLSEWMDAKDYSDIASLVGAMSRKNSLEPWIYTRAQYVKLLLRSEKQ